MSGKIILSNIKEFKWGFLFVFAAKNIAYTKIEILIYDSLELSNKSVFSTEVLRLKKKIHTLEYRSE